MTQYDFKSIDRKWQKFWTENETYKVDHQSSAPKYYVLDMFPYPSGAGLHVGHPLGYIASDIFSRYKRLKGYNVLHPMGFDAFGLPAEQYAIQTGKHPAETTKENIATYKSQLGKLGLSYDASREIKTSDPAYYKWTQWAVLKFFDHWFDEKQNRARPISELTEIFTSSGTENISAHCSSDRSFSASEWKLFDEKEKQEILLDYRLAYLADSNVNWCPALGTVLANDEIKDGLSERGGHPVEQKTMRQWSLRVGAYAPRLLEGLDTLDWPDSIKEVQRNWIGRSEGANITFKSNATDLHVYTTRPDTIYGVTFMVLAPESEYVEALTTEEQKPLVESYLKEVSKKTERDRQANVKEMTGVFTGSYAVNPISGKSIPVWIADYVLGGYGTGAIMAVPAHDERDFRFAKTFNLAIESVYETAANEQEYVEVAKDAKVRCTSGETKGLYPTQAIDKMIGLIESKKLGNRQVNFRLRDAIFSRQRYWGEPFPFFFKDDLPYPVAEKDLPIELPEVDKYLPTSEGEPPLARAKDWTYNKGDEKFPLEYSTMPGFAGSSAYFLRYMDPTNDEELVSKEAANYWGQVDLYVGGSEHATGHLIYSRFWNMFLHDIGVVPHPEPFKKLINQGMILGRSNYVYRIKGKNEFVSFGLKDNYDTQAIHVDVNIVTNDNLDIEKFKAWRTEFENASFILEDGKYVCGYATEKMSKSMFNVVNPDDIVERYGADTLRLFEMFLGPVEQSKPWSTSSIEGVHKFLGRFWRLFYNDNSLIVTSETPTNEELKILHTALKKVIEDTENFAFNTAISAMMICVNDLTKLGCHKKEILEPLVTVLSPYCPHICEELAASLGREKSLFEENSLPTVDESYLVETTFEYPVSFNGKMKFLLSLPLDYTKDQIESSVRESEQTSKFLGDKAIQKVIVVPKKIVNLVVK